MTILEQIKKNHKEIGELIAILENESEIYATSSNWRILFMEIAKATYGITFEDLKIQNRSETILLVRQIFMYLARTNEMLGYKKIASLLDKDHSTCIWGVKKVKSYIEVEDQRFMDVYNNFKHLNFGK
jgi:chromosomal replication initiation ATPase DnaA